jgi:hypothetical protein
MTITAARAVELQAALVTRGLKSVQLKDVFIESILPVAEILGVPRDGMVPFVTDAWSALSCGLRDGETVLVTDQALRLIEYAAGELPPETPFDTATNPFQSAVVWFQEPVKFSSTTDDDPIIGWCDGFVVESIPKLDAVVDQPLQAYFFMIRYGDSHPGMVRSIAAMFINDGIPIGTQGRNDDALRLAVRKGIISRRVMNDYQGFNPKPILTALWSLVGQPIISEVKERPITPDARKARKKLASAGNVRVLGLRQRIQSAGPDGLARTYGRGSREYTHQWIVRGFWRNQPYGPERALRRRVWIDSYVKGPADKPLVIEPKVYRVR